MTYTPKTWNNGDIIYADDMNHIEDGIAGIENDFNSAIDKITDNTNLFNSSTIESDKRLDAAGRTTPSNGYFTSDFIPVYEGQYYTKNSPTEDVYHRLAVYGADRVMLTSQLFTDNTVLIASGGKYIRICGLSTEVATTEIKLITAYDKVSRENLSQIKNGNILVYGNKFDWSTITPDKRLDTAGRTTSANGYFTSDFIPVEAGYTVTKNSPTEDAFHRLAVYGADKVMLPNALYTQNEIVIPEHGKYIRICGVSTEMYTTAVVFSSAIDEKARYLCEQVRSLLGSNNSTQKSASLSGGSSLTITNFPDYLKKNTFVSFYGKFSSFSGLLIGKGYNAYRGDWVEVTATQIIFHHYESNTDNTMQTDTHGLTISDYIMVMLYLDEDGKLQCSVNTKDGTYSTYRQTNYDVFSGNTFATPTADMTDVELCVSNGDTRNPVWCFGDSYLGVNDQRVVGQLKNLGFFAGILFDGLAGLNSQDAYTELNKTLLYGTPKILVWYLGMNDSDADYLAYMELVKNYCEENNITLILNKVPTTPSMDKETIGGYVEASGCRYINSYLAVGTNSSGQWYTGMLSSDNTHPTALGAKALAMRFLVDVPEIAEYGFKR